MMLSVPTHLPLNQSSVPGTMGCKNITDSQKLFLTPVPHIHMYHSLLVHIVTSINAIKTIIENSSITQYRIPIVGTCINN